MELVRRKNVGRKIVCRTLRATSEIVPQAATWAVCSAKFLKMSWVTLFDAARSGSGSRLVGAVLQDLHLFDRDQAARHHLVERRQESVDLFLRSRRSPRRSADPATGEESWWCGSGWNARTRHGRAARWRRQDAFRAPSARWLRSRGKPPNLSSSPKKMRSSTASRGICMGQIHFMVLMLAASRLAGPDRDQAQHHRTADIGAGAEPFAVIHQIERLHAEGREGGDSRRKSRSARIAAVSDPT